MTSSSRWREFSGGPVGSLLAISVVILIIFSAVLILSFFIPQRTATNIVLEENESWTNDSVVISIGDRIIAGRLDVQYPTNVLPFSDNKLNVTFMMNGFLESDEYDITFNVAGPDIDVFPRQPFTRKLERYTSETFFVRADSPGRKFLSVSVEIKELGIKLGPQALTVRAVQPQDTFAKIVGIAQVLGFPALIAGLALFFITRRLHGKNSS